MEKMSYPTYSDLELEIQQLEEENKKLKDRIEHLEFDIEAWKKLKQQLEEQNENLFLEIKRLQELCKLYSKRHI